MFLFLVFRQEGGKVSEPPELRLEAKDYGNGRRVLALSDPTLGLG